MSTTVTTGAAVSPAGGVAPVVPATPTPAGAADRKELGEHTTAPWKIGVLALCPARFYLAAVAKDPRRKESGFEAQVGTLLHHGIEQCAWTRTWLSVGAKEALSPDELLRGIDQPTKNKSVEAARRNPEALAEARVLAKKVAKHIDMAGLIVETVGTQLRPLVEEPWTLDVGEIEEQRVVVGGIWDFVRRRRGRVVVTDWKKGGDLRGTDELRLDPAATLYAAAAKARWPKEQVRVEHFYLTRGASTGIDWTPELDEWARMVALEHARAVLAFERAATWPATPSARACMFCNFRSTCTAFRERVTTGFGLGAFDTSQLGDLEKATAARAKAHEDSKLAERWIEDIDRALEPVVARAAEAGQDELVIAGHVVRRGKRSSHSYPLWRRTIQRLWELTGIAPEDVQDAVLSLRIGAVEDLLATRGYPPEERERIVETLKNETAEERSSTWIEVRAVADPMPTVDVAAILATGKRVELPPPAPPEPKNMPPAAPVLAPPAPSVPSGSDTRVTAPAGGFLPPSYATCVTCGVNLKSADPNNGTGFCEPCREQRKITRGAKSAGPMPQAAPATTTKPTTDESSSRAPSSVEASTSVREAPSAPAVQSSEGARAAPSESVPLTLESAKAALARKVFQPDLDMRVVVTEPAGRMDLVTDEPLSQRTINRALEVLTTTLAAKASIVTRAPIARAEDPKAGAGFGATPLLKNSCECGKSFQNKRGLAGHRRACPTAKKEAPAS